MLCSLLGKKKEREKEKKKNREKEKKRREYKQENQNFFKTKHLQIMQHLLIEEGGLITVRNVSLQEGNFVRLQPQTSTFLDISNPRAVYVFIYYHY